MLAIKCESNQWNQVCFNYLRKRISKPSTARTFEEIVPIQLNKSTNGRKIFNFPFVDSAGKEPSRFIVMVQIFFSNGINILSGKPNQIIK